MSHSSKDCGGFPLCVNKVIHPDEKGFLSKIVAISPIKNHQPFFGEHKQAIHIQEGRLPPSILVSVSNASHCELVFENIRGIRGLFRLGQTQH